MNYVFVFINIYLIYVIVSIYYNNIYSFCGEFFLDWFGFGFLLFVMIFFSFFFFDNVICVWFKGVCCMFGKI